MQLESWGTFLGRTTETRLTFTGFKHNDIFLFANKNNGKLLLTFMNYTVVHILNYNFRVSWLISLQFLYQWKQEWMPIGLQYAYN